MDKEKDKLVCNITNQIIENKIMYFDDLIKHVKEKYGEIGITIVSMKTDYFKTLINDIYIKNIHKI